MNTRTKLERARLVFEEWLSSPLYDEGTKAELEAIKENDTEVLDRFGRELAFGTGGLRGVIGAGTNRMNIYTVRKATQGLANYILSQDGAKKGVAIAYDSRRMSPEFAREAALVLNANGIRTYRFTSLRPTPELSFAVRELHCMAGIVITASHNPREYNGYKVYWEDGAQITPPHDRNILGEAAKITDLAMVKTMDEGEARERGLWTDIGEEVDDAYIRAVKSLSLHPEVIREQAEKLSIVYTPLNGAGNLPVRRILRELGFTRVSVVPEQENPEGGAFPTLAYPNPEDPAAWRLALDLAVKEKADIVMATDPDADRLGIWVRDPSAEEAFSKENGDPEAGRGLYKSFTGNMSGMLIAEYICRERTKAGTMPDHPAVVETIVTTDMAKPLAAFWKAELVEVLTGFKYIGEQIRLFEENGTKHYLFGLEESYGCLAGTHARDKDACSAVMMLAEIAAYYKAQGKTLIDAMNELYEKYGWYKEGLTAVTMKGEDGAEKIASLMESLRDAPAAMPGGERVLAIRDYRKGSRRDCLTGAVSELALPESNVLYYELADGAWCCARPSGTEPKIKFYYGVKGSSEADAEKRLEALRTGLLQLSGQGG